MAQYDVGDTVTLTYAPEGYDSGTCTATLTLTDPAGTSTTPTVDPGTVEASAAVVPDAAGAWRYAWVCTGDVVDVEMGQFDVGDPSEPLYVSLALCKKRMGIEDATDDDEILGALRASCRQVETDTRGKGTHYTLDAVATVRTYSTRGRIFRHHDRWVLLTDDIGSTDGLTVNGSSPIGTYPENALALGRAIEGVILSGLPSSTADVAARWGWPAVPDEIPSAVLLRMHRLYRRKGSPEGVAGFSDMGAISVRKTDPDYVALISEYVRPGLA